MQERMRAIVRGRVQMVMFRDFVQRKASGLKLTGFVRNLKDGTVEVVAEGEQGSLERLEKKLHRGPLLARVEEVTAVRHPATGEFKKFVISYE